MGKISRIAPKLGKLVLLLSSDRPGEVAGAASAIGRVLRDNGADWHALAERIVAPSMGQEPPRSDECDCYPDNWHATREECLHRADALRPREHEFLVSLGRWSGDLTPKQHSWLAAIHGRVRGYPR
jgi:hypothetical protein